METFEAVLFDLFGTLVTEQADAVEGACELLAALPGNRWAIVTSCPGGLARRLIEHAGLPAPAFVVSSDEVERSKPAPDCYALAAQRLGARPERCLVVEDSRQGVAAGIAAGMTVVAVSHVGSFALERGDVREIGALRDLRLQVQEDGAIALR